MYEVSLRTRLPSIRIPLRQDDEDVRLPLQPLFDVAYANGRYDTLDYSKPPVPPLEREDELWAASKVGFTAT